MDNAGKRTSAEKGRWTADDRNGIGDPVGDPARLRRDTAADAIAAVDGTSHRRNVILERYAAKGRKRLHRELGPVGMTALLRTAKDFLGPDGEFPDEFLGIVDMTQEKNAWKFDRAAFEFVGPASDAPDPRTVGGPYFPASDMRKITFAWPYAARSGHYGVAFDDEGARDIHPLVRMTTAASFAIHSLVYSRFPALFSLKDPHLRKALFQIIALPLADRAVISWLQYVAPRYQGDQGDIWLTDSFISDPEGKIDGNIAYPAGAAYLQSGEEPGSVTIMRQLDRPGFVFTALDMPENESLKDAFDAVVVLLQSKGPDDAIERRLGDRLTAFVHAVNKKFFPETAAEMEGMPYLQGSEVVLGEDFVCPEDFWSALTEDTLILERAFGMDHLPEKKAGTSGRTTDAVRGESRAKSIRFSEEPVDLEKLRLEGLGSLMAAIGNFQEAFGIAIGSFISENGELPPEFYGVSIVRDAEDFDRAYAPIARATGMGMESEFVRQARDEVFTGDPILQYAAPGMKWTIVNIDLLDRREHASVTLDRIAQESVEAIVRSAMPRLYELDWEYDGLVAAIESVCVGPLAHMQRYFWKQAYYSDILPPADGVHRIDTENGSFVPTRLKGAESALLLPIGLFDLVTAEREDGKGANMRTPVDPERDIGWGFANILDIFPETRAAIERVLQLLTDPASMNADRISAIENALRQFQAALRKNIPEDIGIDMGAPDFGTSSLLGTPWYRRLLEKRLRADVAGPESDADAGGERAGEEDDGDDGVTDVGALLDELSGDPYGDAMEAVGVEKLRLLLQLGWTDMNLTGKPDAPAYEAAGAGMVDFLRKKGETLH